EGGLVQRIQLVRAVDGEGAHRVAVAGEDQVGHGAWGPVGRARNFPARAVSEQAVSVAVKHWRQYPTVSRRGGQTAPPCPGPTPSVLPESPTNEVAPARRRPRGHHPGRRHG